MNIHKSRNLLMYTETTLKEIMKPE